MATSRPFADRVKETSTTAGTGAFTLAGPVVGFQSFDDAFNNGVNVYYCIAHKSSNEFEIGLGSWSSPNTLNRGNVILNSNGDTNAVDFSAGTKDVFNDAPADLIHAARFSRESDQVFQVAHGFAVGDCVYNNSGSWAKSKADTESTARVDGVVSQVIDSSNFYVMYDGRIEGLSGLTTGKQYYLSPDTAGAITTTKPSKYIVEVLTTESSTKAWININSYRMINNTNYLINGGFRYAQRLNNTLATVNTISDDAYGPDRWKCQRETADLQYQRVDGRGVTGLNCQNFGRFDQITGSGKFMIVQILEGINTNPLLGKVVRFQCKMRGNASHTIRMGLIELQNAGTQDTIPNIVTTWAGNGTDPSALGTNLAYIGTNEDKSVNTSFQEFSISQTIPSDSQNLIVAIWTDDQFTTSDHLEIAEAGLYIEDIPREWASRPVGEELALCQRYYWKSFAVDQNPAQNVGSTGSISVRATGTTANRSLETFVTFPVRMRETPTITSYNTDAANANWRNIDSSADETYSTSAPSDERLVITCSSAPEDDARHRIHLSADSEL